MIGHVVALAPGADIDGFRRALRHLLAVGADPAHVSWSEGAPPAPENDAPGADAPMALPRAVVDMIVAVVPHSDPERYALLHRLAWRVCNGERRLLEIASDPLVHRLERMRKSVARDIHKMHAFVRFRTVEDDEGEKLVAWFEPDHHILEAAAPFFVDRFRNMRWAILTPAASISWDRRALRSGPGASRADAPLGDPFEAGWRAYYESAFNPARLNPRAMRAEMPIKYWRNLPEAQAIPGLVRNAPARSRLMVEAEAAMAIKRNPDQAVARMFEQAPASLDDLNRMIAASEPLTPGADAAVLGEGPVGAAVAFVGEQPGDEEDRRGRPFVGPAGRLLDTVLDEVGIDRRTAYVTNAVKHFKFEQRGKRRIHQKPNVGEVKRYRWWLMEELRLVAPGLVVALGATAALALTGKATPVAANRGFARLGDFDGYITVHPSYLLRLPDEHARQRELALFRRDMEKVRDALAQRG